MKQMAKKQTKYTREILNDILAQPEESSWELFQPALLTELGFNKNVLLFYSPKQDALALLLWRHEPSNESFTGNFPCSRKLLEWVWRQERTLAEARDKGVKTVYVVTFEGAQANKIIAFALASDVISRLSGTKPFVSSVSGDEFYWLDEDLFPAKIHSKRRIFRRLEQLPDFLNERVAAISK